MSKQATLVKFGQHEHILQLREEGVLYMNNLPYFWGIEDENLRGDPCDCVDEVTRGNKAKIALADGTEFKGTKWTLRMHPHESEKINIFCMYALSAGSFPVDEKNYRFGNYSLVLTNPQEFIDIIDSHLKSQNIKGRANLVEYVDDEHIGKVGPFRKLRRFAYQSEWRLVCDDGPGEARKISIGSIRDISTIMLSSEINDKFLSVATDGVAL